MNKWFLSIITMIFLSSSAFAELEVGKPAPDFELTDTKGTTHKLSNFKGKTVVLEWFNHDCPFVVKHYKSGNMPGLQKKYTEAGVIWLSINSGSKASGSYRDPATTDALTEEHKALPTAVLLDESGTTGKLYGAKTTPHMYIIDSEGTLRYQGAIDSTPSADAEDIATSENYVSLALDAISAGTEIASTTTKAYGCSVKY
jgi:peroxiredoxin